MPRCPGQDQQFWKPDDIFEVTCPYCNTIIEFWKDDPGRKCPKCKSPVVNPKLDLGCAQWCANAQECLEDMTGPDSKHHFDKLMERTKEPSDDHP